MWPVGAVVVSRRRVHGQVVDQVPVRLVEGEVPVVVLVARLGEGVLVAVVDVVAQAHERTDSVLSIDARNGRILDHFGI